MELKNKIEAVLFISGSSLEIKTLTDSFNISKEKILKEIKILQDDYKDSGINIEIINKNSIQMITNPKVGKTITEFFNQKTRPKKLSKAALETMSIVLYNQPVTRLDIEEIRGVNVENVLSKLEKRGFIEVIGHKDSIGNPKLYQGTKFFLDYLGINSVEELPHYTEVNNGTYKVK